MNFCTQGSGHKAQTRLQVVTLICLFLGSALITLSQAEDLYITDDYLQGLDDEISSVDYVKKAKEELAETEKLEQAQTSTPAEIHDALISMFKFDALIRTRYPSTNDIYSKLPISTRILVYSEFKKTKKLSTAKRMIIQMHAKK